MTRKPKSTQNKNVFNSDTFISKQNQQNLHNQHNQHNKYNENTEKRKIDTTLNEKNQKYEINEKNQSILLDNSSLNSQRNVPRVSQFSQENNYHSWSNSYESQESEISNTSLTSGINSDDLNNFPSYQRNSNGTTIHKENIKDLIQEDSSSSEDSESSTSTRLHYKESPSDEDVNNSSTSIGENSSDTPFDPAPLSFQANLLSNLQTNLNSHYHTIHQPKFYKEVEQPTIVHRKILYEQQPFPDDYTGPSFLAEIIENENMIPYDYWLCVQETGAVTQQIALVGIYTCVFLFLQQNIISVWFACFCIMASLIGGYSILYKQVSDWKLTWKYLNRSMLIVVILFGTSPIMRTLTIEYSSDTIIALVVALFIVHLYTHDYAFMNGYNSHFNCSLSLNSVHFVSILCASQLPTSLHAFVVVSLCILLFALFPVLRHHLKVHNKYGTSYDDDELEHESFPYHILTILLCITAMIMLSFFSKFLVFVFGFLALFITFVIPYCLIVMQTNYKYHVSGPWDEKKLPIPVNVDIH